MNDTNNTCFVTGGAGFIGSAIANKLLDLFSQVVVIDIMHPQIHKSPDRPADMPVDIHFIHGDVTDKFMWDNLLGKFKPKIIIHLAAETGTGQSLTESSRHSHTNVCGTTEMLDALVRHDAIPQQIILASSRAVYGEGSWLDKTRNNIFYPGQRTHSMLADAQWDFPNAKSLPSNSLITETHPVSIYGATKLAQEHLLSSWSASFGVDLVVLRLQNVYGPGQSLINSYTGILSLFCRLARNGESIPLYEDGEMLRDFILIDDVAKAILQAIINPPKNNQKPYDIGTGIATSIAEIAKSIATKYNAPMPYVCGKFRNGDVRHASCNIDAAQSDLKWSPHFSTEIGLSHLIEWIESQY